MSLDFQRLRDANLTRCEGAFHPIDEWSPTDWMTATAGELGEAANIIKKARRSSYSHLDCRANTCEAANLPENGMTQRERIGEELADAIIYIDLLAARLRLDLSEEVVRKFNIVSEEKGSTIRL